MPAGEVGGEAEVALVEACWLIARWERERERVWRARRRADQGARALVR